MRVGSISVGIDEEVISWTGHSGKLFVFDMSTLCGGYEEYKEETGKSVQLVLRQSCDR